MPFSFFSRRGIIWKLKLQGGTRDDNTTFCPYQVTRVLNIRAHLNESTVINGSIY